MSANSDNPSTSSTSSLAIDFGTSNSLVGIYLNGEVHTSLPIDPYAQDPTLLRTILFFPDESQCYYGQEAIQQYIEHDFEGRLFRSFKSHLPNTNYLGTVIDNRILTLETLVGLCLLELKKRAEALSGESFARAVIGRPARYSMDALQDNFALHRMRKAAEFAGFSEVRFVPEPLAAAFDYRKSLQSEKLVLIGDFGGGTSDFTLIRLRPESFSNQDVLAIEGCPLAGDALDSTFMSNRLARHFGSEAAYQLPMSSNRLKMPPVVSQRLNLPAHIVHLAEKETFSFIKEVKKCALTRKDADDIERLMILIEDQQIFSFFEEIEMCKRKLSAQRSCEFKFDYPGIELLESFARDEFVEWAHPMADEIFAAMERCFVKAGIEKNQVDLVCLTGGTAQVPFIRERFKKIFGSEKLQAQQHFHSVLGGLAEACRNFEELS